MNRASNQGTHFLGFRECARLFLLCLILGAAAKADRLALLKKQKEAYGDGSPSPAVESMKMYDIGNTVIMTALHAPGPTGKRAYAVRMFTDENGAGWKIVLSAQTDIQPPAAGN